MYYNKRLYGAFKILIYKLCLCLKLILDYLLNLFWLFWWGFLCFGIINIFSQSGKEKEDWIPYRNEVYNFQISYPINWNVIDAPIPLSEFGLRFSAPYNESSHNINEMVTLDILKTGQIIYPDVDTYTNSIINSDTFQEYHKLLTFDDIEINGIPAKK